MNRRIFAALSVVLTTAWVAGAAPSAFAAAATKSAPSILVVGATGGTGKEVVRQAREAGIGCVLWCGMPTRRVAN